MAAPLIKTTQFASRATFLCLPPLAFCLILWSSRSEPTRPVPLSIVATTNLSGTQCGMVAAQENRGNEFVDKYISSRPRWSTIEEFLQSCGEFDGSEAAGSIASEWLMALKPLFNPVSMGPSFDQVLQALNDYNDTKSSKVFGNGSSYTCWPWVPPAMNCQPRIGLVLVAAGDRNNSSWNLSIADKRQYALHHGYGFHLFEDEGTGRHPAWTKLPVALQVFNQYDWIFGIDLDAIIVDHNIRLEPFLDPRADVIFNVDPNGMNTGVYFLRSCNWTRLLLAEAWTRMDAPAVETFWEQAALNELVAKDYMMRNHAKFLPQDLFNEYLPQFNPEDGPPQPGNKAFILHFAGRGDKFDLVDHYYKLRKGRGEASHVNPVRVP